MPTKSNGPPDESLGLRKQRTQLRKQRTAPPEAQSPPLQIRPEPKPPTRAEQNILDLLREEYQKADAVARAGARFEVEVHEQQVQQRIAEGFSEDEAGEISRLFSSDTFNGIFRQLLQLRVERRLIRKLGLTDFESDIMKERVRTMFGPKPTTSKSVVIPHADMLSVGPPEIQQEQERKRRRRR